MSLEKFLNVDTKKMKEKIERQNQETRDNIKKQKQEEKREEKKKRKQEKKEFIKFMEDFERKQEDIIRKHIEGMPNEEKLKYLERKIKEAKESMIQPTE